MPSRKSNKATNETESRQDSKKLTPKKLQLVKQKGKHKMIN